MKTKQKRTGKISKRPVSSKRKQVKLTMAKRAGLRHFRLIEHKHTFKLIHHRHTSHFVLFLILVMVGFFMYASDRMVSAQSSGGVMVGAIVPGPPPPIGATITSPTDESTFKDKKIIDISGTCYGDSFVIVKSNDSMVGSTSCSSEGLFDLQVQLNFGKNVLTALNYDNLNQAGPSTPSVIIYITETKVKPKPEQSESPSTPTASEGVDTTLIRSVEQALPDNPSIITGVSSSFLSCNDYKPGKLPSGGDPRVAVVCVPRLFMPGMQQVMGVLAWGGTPPYALLVHFGVEGGDEGEETKLISLSSPGYTTIKFSYAIPGTYKIKFRLSDKENNTAVVETAVQVNGEKESQPTSIVSDITKAIFGKDSWFESPVPFYLLAVAITLGFWGGDIFDRKFGTGKPRKGRRAAAI